MGGGGGLGGGPLVGCRLKFSHFVGSRLKFSIFVGWAIPPFFLRLPSNAFLDIR